MSVQVRLVGPNGKEVVVTDSGELAVAPLEHSEPVYNLLDVADTAYNFFRPRPGFHVVITDITLSGNRNVTTQTLTEVYESTASDSIVVARSLFKDDIGKLARVILNGLHWEVSPGVFLNAKCDDDDVHATIAGYYTPATEDRLTIDD